MIEPDFNIYCSLYTGRNRRCFRYAKVRTAYIVTKRMVTFQLTCAGSSCRSTWVTWYVNTGSSVVLRRRDRTLTATICVSHWRRRFTSKLAPTCRLWSAWWQEAGSVLPLAMPRRIAARHQRSSRWIEETDGSYIDGILGEAQLRRWIIFILKFGGKLKLPVFRQAWHLVSNL
jgi:hypothetical protein